MRLMLSLMLLFALAIAIATAVILDSREPTANVILPRHDYVEIDKAELKICCEMENGEGCYVLKGRQCSHCSSYCLG
jgi:hypothetical protein